MQELYILPSRLEYPLIKEILTPISELKNKFKGKHNDVINYFADLGEGRVSYEQIKENIVTAIAEHPIADSIGIYSYQGNWEDGQLMFHGSSIEKSLNESIENVYGQIPDFELPRNQANANFYYNKLKPLRTNMANEKHVLIEFSPSPANMYDEQVQKRGYRGNDSIFIYEHDESGTEHITQHWFPAAALNKYYQLFNAMGYSNTSINNEVEVMRKSGEVSSEQLQKVLCFIDSERQRFLNPEVQSRILEIKDGFISSQVSNVVMEKMLSMLSDYQLGRLNDKQINQGLAEISNTMEDLQFQLRLMIRDFCGINTLDASTNVILERKKISHQEYFMLDNEQRGKLLCEVGYKMTGCGFGKSTNPNNVWGNSGGILRASDKELYEFICPHCGTKHYIDVPNKKYVTKCKNCGFNATC